MDPSRPVRRRWFRHRDAAGPADDDVGEHGVPAQRSSPPDHGVVDLRATPVPPVEDADDEADTVEGDLPSDAASVLARLARLRDAGLVTPEEYEEERRRLSLGLPARW